MSLESVKAFIERIKTDEDFRNKVIECKDPEARKALVEKEGFKFTVEDLKLAGFELDESDLEGVAGGSGCNSGCPAYDFTIVSPK